ncbi:hypothetical protein [Streptomyces chryseus]|nr:hypothetical protein [Streptomyces chryseus]
MSVSGAFEGSEGIAAARDLARSFLTDVQAAHGLPVSGRAMGMVPLAVSELVTNARKYAPANDKLGTNWMFPTLQSPRLRRGTTPHRPLKCGPFCVRQCQLGLRPPHPRHGASIKSYSKALGVVRADCRL